MKIQDVNKANEKYVLRSKKDPSLFLSSHIIKYRYDYDDDNYHKGQYKAQNQRSLKHFQQRQEERKNDPNYLVLDIPYHKLDQNKCSYLKGKYYYHLFALTKDPEKALCYTADKISIDLMNLIKRYIGHNIEQFREFQKAILNDQYNQYTLLAFQSTDFFKFIDENFHFVKPVFSISYDGEPESDASAILMANCFNVTSDKQKEYK